MPQAQFLSDGIQIDFTPALAVAAGDVVVQGELVGVTSRAYAANEPGALVVRGLIVFAKSAGVAFTVGQLLYWDNVAKVATTTVGGNKLLGKVVTAAATSDLTVRVLFG